MQSPKYFFIEGPTLWAGMMLSDSVQAQSSESLRIAGSNIKRIPADIYYADGDVASRTAVQRASWSKHEGPESRYLNSQVFGYELTFKVFGFCFNSSRCGQYSPPHCCWQPALPKLSESCQTLALQLETSSASGQTSLSKTLLSAQMATSSSLP